MHFDNKVVVGTDIPMRRVASYTIGTEVDIGAGHIVLDGFPALAPPPLFSAHIYCGHGRPSQLLLSSCTNGRPKISKKLSVAYLIRSFSKMPLPGSSTAAILGHFLQPTIY